MGYRFKKKKGISVLSSFSLRLLLLLHPTPLKFLPNPLPQSPHRLPGLLFAYSLFNSDPGLPMRSHRRDQSIQYHFRRREEVELRPQGCLEGFCLTQFGQEGERGVVTGSAVFGFEGDIDAAGDKG